MALKPCRECGKEVADAAKSCPHCGIENPGTDPKKDADTVAKGCLVVILIVGVIYVIGLVSSDGSSGSAASSPPELSATVRFTGTQITVRNMELSPWTDCTVEINAGILRGGWSTRAARISAGETVAAGILTFTKSGGERFDPASHAVETVDLSCMTSRGRSYWSGAF